MRKTGKKIKVNGIVQGVGFRPFVWKIANANNLKGFVKNTSHGVIIEVYGYDFEIDKFIYELKNNKPPQSEIALLEIKNANFKNFKSFKILKSKGFDNIKTSIPVDLGICKDCEKEIFDNQNRRYLYPFTNCTNCGPRFSIIRKIPYDRKFTTMNKFKMCDLCQKEYENPRDRRFHAQPNACPQCGPKVWISKNNSVIYNDLAIDFIIKEIMKGKIVAIKGLGGFHIACDAFNKESVDRLRKFKNRPDKPFAVMCDDLNILENFLFISEKEKELLKSYKSPIVMLKKKKLEYFKEVSPQLSTVGVMLPYTPLHKIIFYKLRKNGFLNPLIMTSGNFRDEPIVKDNEVAEKIFSRLDGILFHNRQIHNRIDDSVCFIDAHSIVRIIRRARGYVPQSIRLQLNFKEDILSCGADIKNCFALVRKNEVFLSQYIGDLEQKDNMDFYNESISNMQKLLGIKPSIIICDLHPGYYSSKFAEKLPGRKIKVQHHLAHILSVMAENNLKGDVIGVSFDGTGYGMDGNIWGGEFFILNQKGVKRIGSLKYFPLPGGDLCAGEVWRILVSLFVECGFKEEKIISFFENKIPEAKIEIVLNMLRSKVNSPLTSSMGRIFDAFSALIKRKFYSTYEAQLPMEAESLVCLKPENFYEFDIVKENGYYWIDYRKAFIKCFKDYILKKSPSFMSEKFHRGLCDVIIKLLKKLKEEYKINRICLSGGVFQNKVLIEWLSQSLLENDFEFYFNEKVPSNDGGIALGQIYYWALYRNRNVFKML